MFCRYFKSQWGFPMRKDMEFNDLIDMTIIKMKDAGIHDSIMRRYGDAEGGSGNCGKRVKGSSLNLFTTVFFFIILFVGIVLSSLLFLLEISWSKCKQEKSKEKDSLKTVKW